MELGKANYGSNKETFKIKDGDNVFRILPPMGKLAKKGFWNAYYRVEWGYKNTEGRQRPFQDVRVVNFKTKMVEVESAAHLRREALLAEKTSLIAALRKDPKNDALKTKLLDVAESIKRYNLDAKYYLNAVGLDGKIGLLKIGSRAFKALKEEIEKLRKTGVDPLSVDNGRFFNFHRSNATGNFQDTAYQVTVYQEVVNVNGKNYKDDKVHVMDDVFISRLSDEAFELSGMYPVVTPEEVAAMVREGAVAVDRILGTGNNRDNTEETEEIVEKTETLAVDPAVTLKATNTVNTETLTANKGMAAMSIAQELESQEETVDTSLLGKNDLSDDEFIKSLGVLR